MVLVSETYFDKYPILLDSSKDTTKERIGLCSDYCEAIYLKKLLGMVEYQKYVTDKALIVHDAKYTNLLADGNFTFNGKTYYNDIKQMLAYFMYLELVQDSSDFNTVMGQQSAKVDNSMPVTDSRKILRAGRLAIELYETAWLYLRNNITLFPDFKTELIEVQNSFGI